MKFYVTYGGTCKVWHVGNPYEACMKSLKYYVSSYFDVLPSAFRVSQRGFDIHDDDEIIPSSIIISLQLLTNHYGEDGA